MSDIALNVITGEWYLGVYCKKCKAAIPVFHDPGRGEAVARGRGKLSVACPHCGKQRRYRAQSVVSFLISDDGPHGSLTASELTDPEELIRQLPTRTAASAQDQSGVAAGRDQKRLAEMFRAQWVDEAKRPHVVAALQPILQTLKRRADASGHGLLSQVAALFADYLGHVAPQLQNGAEIENYLDALLVVSTQNPAGVNENIGEQMVAGLRKLNRRAGARSA